MPTYRITSPDGGTYRIQADNDQQAQEAINSVLGNGGPQPPAESNGGPQGPGKLESAERGVAQGFLYNFGDELGALAAVSPIGGAQKAKVGIGNFNPIDAALGGARILGEKAGLWGDGSAQKDYDAELARQRQANEAAQTANPGTYLVGNIGGAIANPLNRVGPAPAATVPGRIAQGAALGAGQGAIYGAGEGEGGIGNRLAGAGSGALVGGLTGGAATGVIEAAVPAASKVAGAWRSIANPDDQAARVVSRSLQQDAAEGTAGMAPQDYATALRNGDPVVLADMGGARTISTARSAANTSPEARGVFDNLNDARFQTQGERVNDTLRQAMGEPEATGTDIVPYDPNYSPGIHTGPAKINAFQDLEDLQAAAKKENGARYDKAHADAESVDLWNPEFQRIASSPTVRAAIMDVTKAGNDAAVAGGSRAIRNPFTIGKDGNLRIRSTVRADGSQETVRPNLEFWDHVQRRLRGLSDSAMQSGDSYKAGQIGSLRKAILRQTDAAVPAFREAREGAAKFFGAADAHEAGTKFFSPQSAINMGAAQKALNKMSKSERELFARGYAAQLAEAVNKVGDKQSVLNRMFVNNPQARLRTQMALGPRRAAQMEARFRIEGIMDRLRQSMGNSSTARQLTELGLASGAGGALGFATGGDPSSIGIGALVGAATRFGVKKIDARVAERVGKMLASNDPASLNRLAQSAAADKKVMDALRTFQAFTAKIGGGQGGTHAPGLPQLSGYAQQNPPAQEDRRRRP